MDFSLTTLFVIPASQTELPGRSVGTENLKPGELGFYDANYESVSSIPNTPYFYIAQGRQNNYLQASKRSDKISVSGNGGPQNIMEYYKVKGCPTPNNQVTKVGGWHVGCGEDVTVTLRAHSSYIDTLYFNGFTRSVTVTAPCCACDGGDACADVDVPKLIDQLIIKFLEHAPGINSDNIDFSTFYTFRREGNDKDAMLVIEGKPLTKYGVPCDVAAFPFEYDRMWFRTFAYVGPATTADFIVADACNVIATPVVVQKSTYATGTAAEFSQLEKNFYSYQAGYLKALYRMAGYNQNFESYVTAGASYDSYYIKFTEYGRGNYDWGAYVPMDSTVIIAAEAGSDMSSAIEEFLNSVTDTKGDYINECQTTTSTTTAAPGPTTTTTTTLQP
jgi:hypothetical protein